MAALSKGELFAPELVTDIFSKVSGKSSIVKLSKQEPISFNGNEIFTFSMDNEVNIVAEGGKKDAGSISVNSVKVVPVKVEYGARVTDEFMYASDDKKIDILKAFIDGYSKKIARAIDIMSMHGVNPRTKTASTLIGTNSFDTNTNITKVNYDASSIESNIETAIAAISEGYDVSGMAMSKDFATQLASLTTNGVRQYPELMWGASPESIHGLAVDTNSTVSFNSSPDKAILGDFNNAFKWGYAKEIPMEVIQYGDPDQTGQDLKAYNMIYLRAETYLGWAILDPTAFAVIRTVEEN